jgi:hypothetical protein
VCTSGPTSGPQKKGNGTKQNRAELHHKLSELRKMFLFILVPFAFGIHIVSSSLPPNWTAEEQWPDGDLSCVQGLREFDEITQKRTYYVGVHAPTGVDTAYSEFNMTFEVYLNEAVGKRWDPPIEFKMKATDNPLRDWLDNGEEVDFMYTDTGIFSCIGTEVGAQPLATTIASLSARGRDYKLDVYAGKSERCIRLSIDLIVFSDSIYILLYVVM